MAQVNFNRFKPAVKRASAAFTLIEVVFAFAILMIGIGFTSTSLVRGMRQKSDLNTRRAAYSLCSSKIEEAFAGGLSAHGACEYNPGLYWTRTVGPSSIRGMSEVRVKVVWSERGAEKKYFLSCLVRDER